MMLAVALAAAGARTPLRAEDNADQNVYVDYLAGSWDDWSFNAVRMWNATEHVHSCSYAGKISITQAYGAFQDAVGVGVTTYQTTLGAPRFLFVFPSYSITVLTLKAPVQ